MSLPNRRIPSILTAIALALVALVASRRAASSFTPSGVGLGDPRRPRSAT